MWAAGTATGRHDWSRTWGTLALASVVLLGYLDKEGGK